MNKQKQCNKCKGTGYIERIKEDYCSNCKGTNINNNNNNKFKTCYLCENRQSELYCKWILCDKCYGYGEIKL